MTPMYGNSYSNIEALSKNEVSKNDLSSTDTSFLRAQLQENSKKIDMYLQELRQTFNVR